MRHGRLLKRVLLGALLVAAALIVAVFAVAGYFDRHAFVLERPTGGRSAGLVAVYWSGDMGMKVGMGRDIIDRLRADGIPVLTVSSPVLFASGRDAGYADRVLSQALRRALALPGADHLAVVGSSFGSDMVVATLGRAAPDLRRRIEAVALVGPGRDIYFHANPSGLFYRGPSAVVPAVAVPLLAGLRVTCIYGAADDETLCRDLLAAGMRRVRIEDGHMMLHSHATVAREVLAAVRRPPPPMP